MAALVKIKNAKVILGSKIFMSNIAPDVGPTISKSWNVTNDTNGGTLYTTSDITDLNGATVYTDADLLVLYASGSFTYSGSNYTTETTGVANLVTYINGYPVQIINGQRTIVGNVNINFTSITSLPDFSGVYVTGDFNVSHNLLTSLVGSPSSVDGVYGVNNNALTSISGAPVHVGANFYTMDNPDLNGEFSINEFGADITVLIEGGNRVSDVFTDAAIDGGFNVTPCSYTTHSGLFYVDGIPYSGTHAWTEFILQYDAYGLSGYTTTAREMRFVDGVGVGDPGLGYASWVGYPQDCSSLTLHGNLYTDLPTLAIGTKIYTFDGTNYNQDFSSYQLAVGTTRYIYSGIISSTASCV